MRFKRFGASQIAAACLALAPAAAAQAVKVDPKIPDYKAVQGVSGNVKSIGSNTMSSLMTLWCEGFKALYPNVTTENSGSGSGQAPPALIEGSASFGAMSRRMKDQEQAEFEKKYGYKATGIATAIDMLAVYVHKDNPLKSLTLQQVDAIFSKTRNGGFEKDVVKWGDLGLSGEWADKPISLYGRDTASGTYDYFKEHALFKGDFKSTVKEQAGTAAVVQAVATDKFAIGYGGFGALTADVRAVSLALDAKSPVVEAKADNAYAGTYPLSRFLYVYVNYKPGSQLDPLRREFVKYVLSQKGQANVSKDGYFPVTAKIALDALKSVGITDVVEAGAAKH
jgi:phosphate transport system substrate-binding protein